MAFKRSAVRLRLAPPAFSREASEGCRAEAPETRLRPSLTRYRAQAGEAAASFGSAGPLPHGHARGVLIAFDRFEPRIGKAELVRFPAKLAVQRQFGVVHPLQILA